jgi:hypothetical protein
MVQVPDSPSKNPIVEECKAILSLYPAKLFFVHEYSEFPLINMPMAKILQAGSQWCKS